MQILNVKFVKYKQDIGSYLKTLKMKAEINLTRKRPK